ncbi:Gfo/Idh/MocA family protein [Oceanospirillum sanctuarii]|uniref:Gfo/Idh/MocA family protein n=1 Tax=Oceanospirillum sanctuarii TaxID=1434821 RepID=UPI000A3C0646|nr:Gfo/Idh/MocA family oxidoreductase [Oceanospirillum sanctuarii]
MQNVAVIGLGSIARRHRKNLKQLYPDCTLFAMSASGRQPEQAISDCDQLVESVDTLIEGKADLVIVASPAPFHARHALPLIRAGIPVLIEKPLVTESADLEALLQASQYYQTPVAVGYCLRYLPSAQKMQQLLQTETIGMLYNASIEIGQYLPDWRPDKDFRTTVSAKAELGGGALFELSHELDYSRWLLGELDIKAAVLRSSEALQLDVEDCVDLLAVSEQGVVTSIHLDFLQRAVHRRCRFTGSSGSLEWDLIENSIAFSDQHGSKMLYQEPCWDKNRMYLDMIRDFENKVNGKEHQCVSLEDAGKTITLIESIRQHAQAGSATP